MIRTLLISLLMLLQALSVPEGDSLSGTEAEGNDLNVAEVIFEHIGDAYEWHIASWGTGTLSSISP